MEANSERNAKETRIMTPKQHVKAIYPDAVTIKLGTRENSWPMIGVYSEFRLITSPSAGGVYRFGKWQQTYQNAWKEAWEHIQRSMIRKLES